MPESRPESLRIHPGSCHCGGVRIEVQAPAVLEVTECSCSMCARLAYLHLIVPAPRFRLVAGRELLTSYRFHTRTADHLFCRVCGIKSFYVPRSHPEGFSVNARCLDPSGIEGMQVTAFDGLHWEEHRDELAPLPDR